MNQNRGDKKLAVLIREETPEDVLSIHEVTRRAFENAEHSSGTEQFLVDALRREGALTISLVAQMDGELVGHVAISPVSIAGEDVGWYGLGPVSVLPEHQRMGIGSALITEALAKLRAKGAKGCVVLGHKEYYPRFGFRHNPKLVFRDVEPEYFMALRFSDEMPEGDVQYHAAFYDA